LTDRSGIGLVFGDFPGDREGRVAQDGEVGE